MSRSKKPRKPKDAVPPAGSWWRTMRPAALALLTLVLAGGLLAGLGQLGDEALRRIGPRDRYKVRFVDVECDPPPNTNRPTFLAEVRYVGNFPDTFNALDPADRVRLSAAFAAHPWVEAVEGVAVEPATLVRVRLKFRTPVLAVKVDGGAVRLVDGNKVLLPEAVTPPGVAELADTVPVPPTPAGQVWADETVKRAVEVVVAYKPTRLEKMVRGWRLTLPDGRVLQVDR
ncbi:MAG: ftsQ [Gemmataceae bacterium]|nr:ftsQ [Gemmataceae bacterium]